MWFFVALRYREIEGDKCLRFGWLENSFARSSDMCSNVCICWANTFVKVSQDGAPHVETTLFFRVHTNVEPPRSRRVTLRPTESMRQTENIDGWPCGGMFVGRGGNDAIVVNRLHFRLR